jgi:uroporphyrin-III C-methyltransferase/precorrin-2 dehydrogenase/sirohydrochlorin ferrochelatase
MPLFPVFLKLAGRAVLVVGGGPVAAARLKPLLAAGAAVTVVAPEIHGAIGAARDVTILRRRFRPEDLEGAWLVVAAAPPDVNRAVLAAAESARVFVNAVDHPDAATAYTGGVVRKGGLTLAVSTDGRAPALAGLLREALEAVLPDEIERWIEEAARVRQGQRKDAVPISERRPLLLQALNRLYQATAESAR